MKSNTFLSATPEARGKLIAIAYQNLGARFRVMTDETESLNTMLSLARDNADAIIVPDGGWKHEVDLFVDAGDELCVAMLEGANLLNELNKAITYHKSIKKSYGNE